MSPADDKMAYPRFQWLLPGRLAGGPDPELGGGLSAQSAFLREQGVGAIVTLLEDPLAPDPATMGFRTLHVVTPNYRPPPDLPAIIAWIDGEIQQGRGVLVHCFAGIGRTGTVLAAYLIHHAPGADQPARAIAEVRDRYIPEYARDRFPEHPSQEAALETFARRSGMSPPPR